MKNSKILLLLMFIVSSSCKKGVQVTVNNKTSDVLDSIMIVSDFQAIKAKNLKIDSLYTYFVPFDKKVKGDGIFNMSIYSKGNKKNTTFGYYSNGVPPTTDFEILIENDTVLITPK